MPDTEVKKGFLRAIRDALQWLLHIVLIPVLAVLKALDAVITHLIAELSRV